MYGEFAYRVLKKIYNIQPVLLVDKKYKNVQGWGEDIPIITLAQLTDSSRYIDMDILICGANAFQDIFGFLQDLGFKNIYDISELLEEYRKIHLNEKQESNYLYGELDIDEIVDRYNYFAGIDNGY